VRTKNDVFNDLSKLCVQPGFVHVVAYYRYYLYLNDGLRLSDQDSRRMDYPVSILTRKEISTMIGLMLKRDISFVLPTEDQFAIMVQKTESLLDEIHKTMLEETKKKIEKLFSAEEVGLVRKFI
jgi:hypothetical protein